jgi:hypothetical protein
MKIGDRISIKNPNDKGLKVKECLNLIKDLKFYDTFYEVLDLDKKLEDVINIKGAKTIVDQALLQHTKYEKIDIESKLENIHILGVLGKNSAKLEISKIVNPEILLKTRKDIIETETIYNSKRDFFNIFSSDDYINFCLSNNLNGIIEENINLIENENVYKQKIKNFRVLKDNDSFYLRAITSANRYKNYNINFSIFITLLALNEIQKKNKGSFEIDNFSCSESEISLYIKRIEKKQILKDINVSFVLELENDEIKGEAVKFKGVIKVSSKDNEFYISPDEEPNIIYFSHSKPLLQVRSIIHNMSKNIDTFINKTYKHVENISKLNNKTVTRDIQTYIYETARKSKQSEFVSEHRKEVLRLLEQESNTIYDLFEKLGKIDLLIGDSFIKSKDYWRNKIYKIITKGI